MGSCIMFKEMLELNNEKLSVWSWHESVYFINLGMRYLKWSSYVGGAFTYKFQIFMSMLRTCLLILKLIRLFYQRDYNVSLWFNFLKILFQGDIFRHQKLQIITIYMIIIKRERRGSKPSLVSFIFILFKIILHFKKA